MDIAKELLYNIPYLFLHPMLYIGVILIVLQYNRQITLERQLFSSRIHTLSIEVIGSLIYGLFGGIIVSGLMVALGIVFHPMDMWIVWLITGILILFHVRFLCFSYATGILGVVAGILQLFKEPTLSFIESLNFPWLISIFETIININIPSLIAIVAILHLVEAILVRLQSSKQATPIFLKTKRGKLIGAYHIQSFWLLPLFLVVSTGDVQQGINLNSSWWPLIGGGIAGITILPVPAVIGFSDLTSVYTPKEKSKRSSNSLFIYSILLLGMAFIAEYWLSFQIIAALFTGFAHEGIKIINKRKETKLPSLFVHPIDGLRVLAVLPNSKAEIMGINTGEIITKVNGIPVINRNDLYYALEQQSAFVKLEIINLAGQVKFAQHSRYQGDHHQLGIVLAPDDNAPYYIEVNDTSLLQLLKQKVKRKSRGA